MLASAASVPIGKAAFPGANGKIAYGLEGATEIYVMNADGTDQTNITNNTALDVTPVWSPDGKTIAFNRDGDVHVMNADGSNQTNITNAPFSAEGPSSWSPDGSKILFSSDRDGNTEIYVMNADGSNPTRLTNDPASQAEAAWSPDGTMIAFTDYRDGNAEIYLMNADGGNQTNITNNPAADGSPSWSPDGTKIAFNSHRDNPWLTDVFVMDTDGGNATNLTNTEDVNEQWPAWSPDGSKITYSGSGPGGNDIYVMNADGSNPTDLTNTEDLNEQDPDWQPLVIFSFSGFYPPVDNAPVFNTGKAGSVIPVKFSLDGDHGLDIFTAGYPISQPTYCDASAIYDGIEETVTAGSSSLSYDATADRYQYNWKTSKAWANTCRKLTVRLSDGTDHVVYFTFKK